MDGAARFSQRDALATILITAINIIAGFLIGVFQLNIPFDQALKTYTILTVGDGLVTMIPSLLVSVAGGMVVTRTSIDATVGVELGRQLLPKKRPCDRRRRHVAAGTDSRAAEILLLSLVGSAAYLASRAPGTSRHATPARPGATGEKTRLQQQIETLLKLDELASKSATRWYPWWTRPRAGNCCSAFAPCAATWPCNSAFSFRPSTSPTT